MNRYRCYLLSDENRIIDVRDINADYDVQAVLFARAVAVKAGYRRFELRQEERIVRREGHYSVCLSDECASYQPIKLGDEIDE